MEKSTLSILYLGIILTTLNGVNGATSILSCVATVGNSGESLTVNVNYDGGSHQTTWLSFTGSLRTITAIEAPCKTTSSSSDLTFTSCTNSSSSSQYCLWLNYDTSLITNTNITVHKFAFPEGQSYTNTLTLQVKNSSGSWGPTKNCLTFSYPASVDLLGKHPYYYIFNRYESDYAD